MSVSAPFLMPFGKFKGSPITEVKIDYLRWLTTTELHPPTRAAVEKELRRRESASPDPAQTTLDVGAEDEAHLPKALRPDATLICPHCAKSIALLVTLR